MLVESNKLLIREVVNVLKKFHNIQVIIKLHPRELGFLHKRVLKELEYSAIIVKDVNIFEIIKTADILITQQSVAILDSMVVGTPVICVDFMNRRVRFSGKLVYNDEKYIIKVFNEEELYKELNILLTNKEMYRKYRDKMQTNLDLFISNIKNYSPTVRIISDILSILGE